MRNPRTKSEWQEAADAAQGALALDSARMYGLVIGGPKVNQERCIEILEKANARRVVPSPNAVQRFVAGVNAAAELVCALRNSTRRDSSRT